MILINNFIRQFSSVFGNAPHVMPWEITDNLNTILLGLMQQLDGDFIIKDGIAIHLTATIEQHVVLKAPIIIGANCFIGANAYLRGAVFLGESVKIGPGCEIKQSAILSNSTLAHFNYIGNSIIGSDVNFEAGSVIANHYNEREDKEIFVVYNGKTISTNTVKFGALVGDHSKIGANAVLSPGTILPPETIVKRLQLIDQFKP